MVSFSLQSHLKHTHSNTPGPPPQHASLNTPHTQCVYKYSPLHLTVLAHISILAHTTHTQQPNPVTPMQLSWSDLDSGDGTFSVQPWEEGTSCVFSGCYDNSVERGYPTYWIPETTCTVIESERYQQCVHIW